MINRRGDLKRIFVFIAVAILFSGVALAIYAFPGAVAPNTVLVSQVCSTETASAVSGGFAGLCSATTNIDTNNAVTQTATVNNNNLYMGVRTQSFNSTITNCGGITNVKLCYEWWSSSSSIGSCSVSVDHDGGGSYSTASSTCPGTTANPGEICTDVTSIGESWTCDNFFTASGTRALAYLQVKSTTGGSKTLTVDDLYFNVTYTPDAVAPVISMVYPLNTTYATNVTTLNFTVTETNLDKCWYSLNNGVSNVTVSCTSGVQVNVGGLGSSLGTNSWKVWANDSYSNTGTANVTFYYNSPPTISNITITPDPSAISATLNISGNGVADSNSDTLQFYCSDTSNVPSDSNICSSGNRNNLASPYKPDCLYTPNKIPGSYIVYCRVYDGVSYSSTVNKTYTVAGFNGTLSVISAGGDTTLPYFDNVSDSKTDVLVSGSSGMSCKWFLTDQAYSAAGAACSVVGTTANCSIDTVSEGDYNRYISCRDSLGNEQTSSTNLDVSFVVDTTAPTTTSDADTVSILVPTYEVTIYESDNLDSDPTTYYCTSTLPGCTPTTLINNGGIISFSSSNRGPMYLRFYSIDDAGNAQPIVSETVNINRLPIFSLAYDNAATIKGGTTVTVYTVDYDPDAENVKLFVCNSSGATSSGCLYGQYCSAIGAANLSCGFASETDTATHTWYAYVYDASGESATANNPLTGTYITDYSGPVITIITPLNSSYTQSSISTEITTSETASAAWYSLDGGANVSMTLLSSTDFASTISGLALGQHNLTFYANDSFDNVGLSGIRYFSIIPSADIIAPVITVNAPSNASYVSLSTLINITSDEALNWSGYRLNGGALTSLTNASATSWSAALSGLTQESTNTLIIYANDTSNNQANKTIILYADTSAPRFSSLLIVPNPSNQSQNVNCSIAWQDGFNLQNVIISENSLGSYENHTIIVSGNTSSASYLISGTKLANAGSYSCVFYATDMAGNTNSTTQSFTVNDVVAPTITTTSPGNFTYNQQSIVASIVTNENASAAWYSLNGAANVSMSGSTTSWSATLSSLINGAYNIRFYANDSSGNVGSSSLVYFTINSIADTVPPVVTMISPLNGSYVGTSVSLSLSSNEALNWAGYRLNGGSITNMTNTSTTSWSSTLSGLTQESTNTLIIYANDTSNNQGNVTVVFYSDDVAPRFSSLLIAPSPSNQSQNVNCSIAWQDGFNLQNVIISENSLGSYENHTITVSGNTSSASYLISGTKLANAGSYSCAFYATDMAGNTNSTTQSLTVNDVVAPTITTTSPSNGTYNSLSVPLSILSSEALTSAKYSVNGAANVSMGNISAINWNATLSVLNGNSYTVIFYGTDTSGNTGSSSSVTFTIDTGLADTIAPVLTSTISNASYIRATSLAFNVSSNEALNWSGYTLNSGDLTNLTGLSTTLWNATLSGLGTESTNTLVVNGNDSANNRGSLTVVFYSDDVAPRFSSLSATPNPANETQSVACNAFVNDTFGLASVKISENITGSFVNHTIDLSSTGYANYTITNVVKGSYSCVFYATDMAGNTNSTTQSFTVNDVVAPTITTTSPSNSTYGSPSILASIATNENASAAWYSLDGAANVSMSGSATSWSVTLTAQSVGSHNIRFYANDSSGNVGSSSLVYFTVAVTDVVPPVLTLTISNASYRTTTTVKFNASINENATWVGYILNGGSLTDLTGLSTTLWNATLSGLGTESTNTLVVYANDTSNNQGNLTVVFYSDDVAPRFSSLSATPNPANETQSVVCNVLVNDTFGFGSVKISENATIKGTFLNHTIDLSSTGYANYTITNVVKGSYSCIFYATDMAGNTNSTTQSFTVNDVVAPTISVNSPLNQTLNSNSVVLSITSSENLSSALYSFDNGATNSSMNGSATSWSSTVSKVDGQYTVRFYGNDSSGNRGVTSLTFIVDTSVYDLSSPGIIIHSPLNGSYFTATSILLNISADENISWAAYKIDSGLITNLDNTSVINWNASVNLAEGQHNVTFYANDSSANRNQGIRNSVIFIDLTDPTINSISCPDTADSLPFECIISVSDNIALGSIIVSENSTGMFENSTIDLSGTSESLNFTIDSSRTSPGTFSVLVYLEDASGRVKTGSTNANVLDDSAPVLGEIIYAPTSSDALDPGVNVTINASVTDNYLMGGVETYYKKVSDSAWTSVAMSNSSVSDYSTIVEFGEGNWTFYINASDLAGNSNVSSYYNISVYNDTSQAITSDIEALESFYYAERDSNNVIGNIILNNTGDSDLNFNVTINAESDSLLNRFDINSTGNVSKNYSLAGGDYLNLTIYADLTDLTVGSYNFNVSILSGIENYLINSTVVMDSFPEPHLEVVISGDSRLSRGDSDSEYLITVKNLGKGDASDVYLYVTLPSDLTFSSGQLNRSFTSLGYNGYGEVSMRVNVSSSANSSSVVLYANATSSNAETAGASKNITITNPLTITNTVEVQGGGGRSGGGGGGLQEMVYNKKVEIVRGESDGFDIYVNNTYLGMEIRGVTLKIEGILDKYISVSPERIESIPYGESGKFRVTLAAPAYKGYSSQVLNAYIDGSLFGNSTGSVSYSEKQNILLTIQEVSRQDTISKLSEAEKAINFMKERGYNLNEVTSLYVKAKGVLDEYKNNKESYDLSQNIVGIKDSAQKADELIRRVAFVLRYPGKIRALTGLFSYELLGDYKEIPLNQILGSQVIIPEENYSDSINTSGRSFLTGNAINSLVNSGPIEEMLSLSIAAFERGDYTLANSRAESARSLLVLDLKGNFMVFIYLYWPFILISIALLSLISVFGYRKYQKISINDRIIDLNNEEESIQKLFVANQGNYFSGKIGNSSYNLNSAQYQKRLAQIRKQRVALRNRRISLLRPEQVLTGLEKEKQHIENEIIDLQKKFYGQKSINEASYKLQFTSLQERIAEIEDERLTFNFKKKMDGQKVKIRKAEESRSSKVEEVKVEKDEPADIKVVNKSEEVVKKEIPKKEAPKKEKVKGEGLFSKISKSISRMRQNRLYKDEKVLKEKIERMLNNKK